MDKCLLEIEVQYVRHKFMQSDRKHPIINVPKQEMVETGNCEQGLKRETCQ